MVKPYTTINGKNYTSSTGATVSCTPNTLLSPLKTIRTMTYFCKTTKRVSLYRSWTSKKVVKTLSSGVTVDLIGRNTKYKRSEILYKGKTYYLTTGSLRAFNIAFAAAPKSNAPRHLVVIVYGVAYQGIYSCLLPTLSSVSVSYRPVSRLRHWCSS